MTSTVPAVCAALVTKMTNHASLSGVQVAAAWPGPAAEHEMVFLGEEIDNWTSEVPNMKAGRKQRQETYTLTVEVWVFAGDSTPGAAQTIRDRAVALADVVDDLLAADPTLAVSTVQYITVQSRSLTLVPFELGWGCQATLDLDVNARLT